jgi:hypothetical protein
MMETTFEYGQLEELEQVAQRILKSSDKKIFAFYGAMGVGRSNHSVISWAFWEM